MKVDERNNNLDKKMIEKELKNYFLNIDEIIAVYIFGSFYKPSFNNRSDLDLAVIFAHEIDKFEKFDLKLKMLADLEELTNIEVDLVDFENVDLKIKHNILDGKLIHCIDNSRRVKLEKRAIINYIDMRKRYDIFNKNLGGRF
ncbi:MAG: type VII toxin-antitoxin system MntA family adenylyltransferase antitoxin [Candidatus Woesearchaeota archaeon]